jgi:hypothetical protein
MPSTKKTTPSPNRKSPSPVKQYRRTSPLWKRHTIKRRSPQPQPPQMSPTEMFRIQHEKWKEDQETVKHLARNKTMKKIYENRKKGLYIEPDRPENHPYFTNQQPSNYWVKAQQQYVDETEWESGDVPRFGGKKLRRRRRTKKTG